jgi:NarL family two-component system response regulator LiaR
MAYNYILEPPTYLERCKVNDAIKVMLVEDHIMVREGTKELLDRENDIQIVAEAGDGEEAVRLANERHPDVVIMDIAMPKLNGIEATKRIKAADPATIVLVLTGYNDDQYIFTLLEAGAAGYLLKDISMGELVKAVRAVHAGESVLHPTIARKVVNYFAQRPARRYADEDERESIPTRPTDRETDVLKLTANGMTNREIAHELTISVRTVQVHLSNVFSKLRVGSRTEAVICALKKGWLTLEDVS